MIKQLLSANRRRVAVKYAMIAAGLAVASIVALEAAGTALTTSYSGLGGKLAPAAGDAADVAPVRSTDERTTVR